MKDQKNIFFSVVVPTYNRADLITKTLQSLLCQQYTNYEIIVVDDGSTDNTEAAVKSLDNRRIIYIKKNNAFFLRAYLTRHMMQVTVRTASGIKVRSSINPSSTTYFCSNQSLFTRAATMPIVIKTKTIINMAISALLNFLLLVANGIFLQAANI